MRDSPMAEGFSKGELIALLGHFQRDIEQVKQRQWRDFHASLLAQGSLLFLFSFSQVKEPFLFALLSLMLWVVGSWFVIEGHYALKSYREDLKHRYMETIERESRTLLEVIEAEKAPLIPGTERTQVYFSALAIVTALVITIFLGPVSKLWLTASLLLMVMLSVSLTVLAPRLIKAESKR